MYVGGCYDKSRRTIQSSLIIDHRRACRSGPASAPTSRAPARRGPHPPERKLVLTALQQAYQHLASKTLIRPIEKPTQCGISDLYIFFVYYSQRIYLQRTRSRSGLECSKGNLHNHSIPSIGILRSTHITNL